jgi:WD40 repeat protein
VVLNNRGVEMKHTKKVSAFVGVVVLVAMFLVGVQLHTMEPFKYTLKSRRRGAPVEQDKPRYKSEAVWVRTSDNQLLEIPQWQIDQMKVLQVLFVHQKGTNNKDNPVNASMVSSEQLVLLQKALNVAHNFEEFRKFYSSLSEDQKRILINGAAALDMQGLTSLLMTIIFPKEIQSKMGATEMEVAGIIAPVVEYLQSAENIPLSHTGPVLSVAISPDGNRIISGAAGLDHNLILYDVSTGKEIKNLVSEIFPAPCVAFSPDGQYIITGSSRLFDNLILWDGVTGKQIKIFNQHPDMEVNYVAFSSDSHYVLAGVSSFDYISKPILYDIKSGKMIGDLFAKIPDSMSCVAFRPDSKDIVIGSVVDPFLRKNLVAYDGKTYKEIRTFVGLSQGQPCIALSSDGKYLVGATLELIMWDAETGKEIKVFENTQGCRINDVAFDPLGRYIAANYIQSDVVIVFSCETGKPVQYIKDEHVRCITFSPDGNYLFCGCQQGLVKFKMIDEAVVEYIATQLNIAQARLLYRLYLAKVNKVPVILDSKDLDYQLFKTLPENVQKEVKVALPFELVLDIEEKAILEKMNKYRSSLFYSSSLLFGKSEKTRNEKIKAVKDAMQKLEKDSGDYKACVRLLHELEQEGAFEA